MLVPFTVERGAAAPLLTPNIDTDVIIRIERLTQGDRNDLGRYALEALRYNPDGSEREDCVLNQPRFRNAPFLLAGSNFGCGSSREGAVNALMQMGLRAIIAPSYGDIFFSNCFQNGLLPIRLSAEIIDQLAREAASNDPSSGAKGFEVDLVSQTIRSPSGRMVGFDIDPARRESLLRGLDDVGLTLTLEDDIARWQAVDRAQRPWIWLQRSQQTAPRAHEPGGLS
jgi:3-isopropylmalate/(R)-2-methylmalate dehydratase small subunit